MLAPADTLAKQQEPSRRVAGATNAAPWLPGCLPGRRLELGGRSLREALEDPAACSPDKHMLPP